MTLTTGCGCGGTVRTGGGGGCPGGCTGCGGSGTPMRETGAVRPQYFGGMLLTEEDLQAGIDYVVAKRRLTNRSVFGAGVVCGLDVTCDPCEPGAVTVTPGYAIDCCGNDIVVDCLERIDVLALVRELRERTGVDCGEPCEDLPHQEYVLNVLYAEQHTEPVAPYAQDDCTIGDCEYSRVREGYRFELSCDAAPAEPNLIDVLRDCLATGTDRVKEGSAVMTRLVHLAAAQRGPQEGEPGEAVPPPAAADIPVKEEFDALSAADAALPDAVDLIGRALSVLAADASTSGDAGAVRLASARRRLLSARSRELARRMLASDEFATLDEPERLRVQRLLTLADEQQDLGALGERDRILLSHGFTTDSAEQVYRRDAARMRSEVLRGLTDAGRSGCAEYRMVAALKLDTLDADAYRQVSILGRSWVSVLVRCVCAGANPPCSSCTELRVPLARVRVEDCEVVDVCALERHWVLTPRNLAYWFPIVEALRELLDRRCCDDARYVAQAKGRVVDERELDLLRVEGVTAARLIRSAPDIPALRILMEALGDEFIPTRPPIPDDWGSGGDAKAAAASRVNALEAQVAALRREIDDLTGRSR
jgi:hypothetical protein